MTLLSETRTAHGTAASGAAHSSAGLPLRSGPGKSGVLLARSRLVENALTLSFPRGVPFLKEYHSARWAHTTKGREPGLIRTSGDTRKGDKCVIEIYIPGDPVEQDRPRAFAQPNGTGFKVNKKGRTVPDVRIRLHDTDRVKVYKETVARIAKTKAPRQLLDGPLELWVAIHIGRKKSWPKKKQWADTKPDLSNFLKLLEDAMEGIIYTNDSRIVRIVTEKRVADKPGVLIKVRELAV